MFELVIRKGLSLTLVIINVVRVTLRLLKIMPGNHFKNADTHGGGREQ